MGIILLLRIICGVRLRGGENSEVVAEKEAEDEDEDEQIIALFCISSLLLVFFSWV